MDPMERRGEGRWEEQTPWARWSPLPRHRTHSPSIRPLSSDSGDTGGQGVLLADLGEDPLTLTAHFPYHLYLSAHPSNPNVVDIPFQRGGKVRHREISWFA